MNLKLTDKCLQVGFFRLETPISILKIHYCSVGLHQIDFEDICLNKKENSVRILDNKTNSSDKSIRECLDYFQRYFSKQDIQTLDVPSICWSSICKKDTFTERVLKELIEIKFGSRISYSDLALRAGSRNAQRAVGTAMRKNKIVIVIPCHRVVKSSSNINEIGNYNSGAEVKEWLLKHESC